MGAQWDAHADRVEDAGHGARDRTRLHGDEPDADPGPDTEICPTHGTYTVRSIIDRECGPCLDQDRADRRDAEWDWQISQNLRPF